jgi:hypothetical protein
MGRNVMFLSLFTAFIALLIPLMLRAQEPAVYQRSDSDTLIYRETTTATIGLKRAQGIIPMSTDHDARMAITFGHGDSATAWYQTLRISATTPQGKQTPTTDSALGLPFILRFDAHGHVETLKSPTFPASFSGISDLSFQFFDYFLALPAKALSPGVTWQDSVSRHDSTASDKHQLEQRWGEYQVAGDTIIDGRQTLIIHARTRYHTYGVRASQGMTITSELNGTDNGEFYWDVAGGRLLGRVRAGKLSGTMHMDAGANRMEFPQEIEYVSRLQLLR